MANASRLPLAGAVPWQLDALQKLKDEWLLPAAVPLSPNASGKTPEQEYLDDPYYMMKKGAEAASTYPGGVGSLLKTAPKAIAAAGREVLPTLEALMPIAWRGPQAVQTVSKPLTTGEKAAATTAIAAPAVLSSDEAEAGRGPSMKQLRTVMDKFGVEMAQRLFASGVYKRPDVIAKQAAAQTAPESPALKQLFGVTRDDLWEIGQRGTRPGNIEPSYKMPDKPAGSYISENLMNPRNAQRQIDTLTEARKFPELAKGMESWYVMDPAFQRMVQLVGKEQAIKDYKQFNTVVPMFSPASEVNTELNRGTAANMMINRGEWDKFARNAGIAADKRGANFPPELRDVVPHPYHSTAQSGPVGRYLETGRVDMSQPKVPLYMQASGVPETGFQTRLPVPDAHWGRSVGVADVRTTAKPGVSLKGPEYHELGPWYRENVAKPLGLEAVPAQGLQWGTYAPQTGVTTQVGAPKLELLSQMIWNRAKKLGVDPATLRDAVLQGREHAALLLGLGGGAGAAFEAYQPQQNVVQYK